MVKVIEKSSWSGDDEKWHGEVLGRQLGAGICLIFNEFDTVGAGPRLHSHPYPETFIIKAGSALFTVGDREIRAAAGQILTVPAGVPHKFSNLGPGRLETIDIHENEDFVTDWLE
ncbi:MAG: cupin domain-containing protein [Rhizobiaceae bacterium]|nr:cupin domain-containing protein [Rhizobiaceae bacterium]